MIPTPSAEILAGKFLYPGAACQSLWEEGRQGRDEGSNVVMNNEVDKQQFQLVVTNARKQTYL